MIDRKYSPGAVAALMAGTAQQGASPMSDPSDKSLAQADTIGRAFIEVLGDPAISWRDRPTSEFARAVATRARELEAAKGGDDGCERCRDWTTTLGVGDGSGQLFVHGPYGAIKACQHKLLATPPAQAAEAVEPLTASMCHHQEYAKGWNAAIAAMQAGE